ncbi:Aste57867_21199 [Aphanomyces stellatus]|uniref:Aste57867_21199 protein n=1 Tax=Aphanomyces stellatus TaxID=120398 RepID=A0A485LIC4_9STRA|nr:hypothetical protein As57867_021131 [Aphanomyces stellatus]VFT97873.1 Aste57867_21199 [Aphanomyces stellatus]
MKTSLFVLTVASAAVAQDWTFSTLGSSEQAEIHAKLSKWKALYGPIALEHGLLPPSSNQESLTSDDHSQNELERFHNTILDVQEASKHNPHATFSEFNIYALLTKAEFEKVVMKSFAGQNFTDVKPMAYEDLQLAGSGVDWSTNKCNPPVKNQGQCGSCWAFSTVGTAEMAHCITTGQLLDLSEQQLVSCATDNYGCDGGFPPNAIDYIHKTGVCSTADYPYTSGTNGYTGSCNNGCAKKQLSLGATQQTSGETSLQTVLNAQPTTVVVEAGNPVWQNYKGGVVTHCPGGRSDHAVIAVGYGTKDGVDFFKIKNSWGAQWGDSGYIYLQRGVGGKGMCNVAEGITYPQLNGAPAPTSNAPAPTTPYTDSPATDSPSDDWPTDSPSDNWPTDSPDWPTDTPDWPTDSPSDNWPTDAPSDDWPTDAPSDDWPTDAPSDDWPTDAPYTPPSPSTGSGVQDQLIAQTNKIRAAHQLPPVSWDATLASQMQAWADSCPGFQHGGPSGWQNLATNTPCTDNCLSIVGAPWLWYNQEETQWNYNSHRCNGDWGQCGHFSNMMSPSVTTIACGWSECANGNYVWCNYNTPVEQPVVPRISGMTKDQLKASLTQ